jgi:hypothetical protein
VTDPLFGDVMQLNQLASECFIELQRCRYKVIGLRSAAEGTTSLAEASRLRALVGKMDQRILCLTEERASYIADMKLERSVIMDCDQLRITERCFSRESLTVRYQQLRRILDPERQVGITRRKKAERELCRVTAAYRRLLATLPPDRANANRE